MLEELITEILTRHRAKPPLPRSEREPLLSEIPFVVPADVQLFFSKCNGARLFDSLESRYELVGVQGFHPTRFDIFGHDEEIFGPLGLFTICDVQDGNFVALDLSKASGSKCPVVDCFHETFADPGYAYPIIAQSFTDFLAHALRSENRLYWL